MDTESRSDPPAPGGVDGKSGHPRAASSDGAGREREERERLAALWRYDVLDTPPEERFDRVTRLAAHLTEAPMAQISLIDADRQWVKSAYGRSREEATCPREESWCARTLETPDVTVVENVQQDERFAESRLVTGPLQVCFYAAAPLVAGDGARIGTLCVFDTQVRTLSEEKQALLRDLAATVVDELELRQSLADASETEAALREEEQFANALIDGLPGLFYLFDEDGTLLRWNEHLTDTTSYPDAQIAEMHPVDFVAEDGRQRVTETIEKVFATGQAATEVPFMTADGRRLPFWCTGRRVQVQGRPCVVGLGVSLQGRKRVERRLRASEEKYARLFETANDAILIFETKGEVIMEANAKAAEMYGIEREALIGQSLKAFTEDVERGERALYRALQTGSLQGLETKHRRRDGTLFDVLVNASVISFRGREALLSIHRDITQRKRAEARTREMKTFYENILDEVPVEIAVLDAEGRYRYINRAVLDDAELRRWMIGKTDLDYARRRGKDFDLYRERHDRVLDLIARKEAGRRLETMTAPDGQTLHLMGYIVPVLDEAEQVKYVIGYTVDLTERKKHEEGLRRAKERAEEASQAKDAIINNMSHELRTPLASMIGFADVLLEGLQEQGEGDGEQAEFARIIRRSGQRLQQTLESVLELARLEAGRRPLTPSVVDMKEWVAEVVAQHQPQAREKGLALHAPRQPVGALPTRADETALDRVLTNLIANALKFTEEGSVVVTTGRLTGERPPRGSLMAGSLDETEKHVFVCVQDTGIGISEAFRSRLFKEFEQESSGLVREHQGVGLGLSIVRRLVIQMGGAVFVESEKGVGTVFTVCLPAAEA